MKRQVQHGASGRLSFDQAASVNRELFIKRLEMAGWSHEEAEKEYDNIQEDDEDGL